MGKTKESLITKISDRKESIYKYYRVLELDERDFPTEEELDKLESLEDDRSVIILIAKSKMTIVSFKNENKLIRAVKKEYNENWNDKEICLVAYKASENVVSVTKNIIELITIKQALKLYKNDFQAKPKQRKK